MDGESDRIIREMTQEDAQKLDKLMQKPAGMQGVYHTYLEDMAKGHCQYIVIYEDKHLAGYAKIDWKSKYEDFEEEGIPEIKDLQIFEDFRHKGLGHYLLDKIEDIIRKHSDYCGIGIGLSELYEAGARLLSSRGYEPDGKGIFYMEATYAPEEMDIDDNQALMLIKRLNS